MSKRPARPSSLPHFLSQQVLEYRYFFLNATPSPDSELEVVCGGWERCTPDYEVRRADFGFYGMEYVVQGRGLLTVDGVENELLPGSVFAYQPFTKHSIRSNPRDPLIKYFVDFSGTQARRIVDTRVLGTQGIATLHHPQPIDELFEQIMDTGRKGGAQASRICSLLLELLALRIEENAHVPTESHSRSRQSFERSRAVLQKDFRTIRSVTELAELTHFDPAYLSRLFYRFSGERPSDMLIRLKMSEAASHLISGIYSVKEVAAQVGYPDPYHFSRAFKNHYGIPPTRFQSARTLRPGG